MKEMERRVSEILNGPLGCAFLLTASESGLTQEAMADPRISLRVAARCVNLVERWASDHDAIVAEILELGQRQEPLARAILEHPGTAWWFGPPDLQRQVWISLDGAPPNTSTWEPPVNPPHSWETYAQKPLGRQMTSTLFGGHSSLLMAYEERSGDYSCGFPLACWMLQIAPEVRVFEIDGPEAWHDLCLRYPATCREDDRLVPNWGAASEDWDGVHMSFGGLLTCEQVRHESPAGWSKQEFWHAEQTFWLRSLATITRRLPDHEPSQRPDQLRFPRIEAGRGSGTPLRRVDP